jgi:hypothetical protein
VKSIDPISIPLRQFLDEASQGNSPIHIHVDIEKVETRKKPNLFLFDGKDINEIILFFELNYDMNEQRTPSMLVSSFGKEWPYVGRQGLAKRFTKHLLERFVSYKTRGQPDTDRVLSSWLSSCKKQDFHAT